MIFNLVENRCGACDVVFGMTTTLYNARKEDQKSFWCPNGHERHFVGPTEADKLRKIVDVKNRELGFKEDRLMATWRSSNSLRGVITKLKKELKRL